MKVFAPCISASFILIEGVSFGQKTNDSMPDAVAYAASAAPAFPFVGIAIFFIPNSLALATPRASPLALKLSHIHI